MYQYSLVRRQENSSFANFGRVLLVRFANVLFCALAVHFIVFLFLSLSSKLSAVSFFYTCP
jgi:hypothetical protein